MIDGIDVRSNDRVLLLSIPGPEVVASLARQLPEGLLVGLGDDDRVREARRENRSLLNVMFVPAPPSEIPWQDAFFNCAIEPAGISLDAAAAAEIARVLAAGGLLHVCALEAPQLPGFSTVQQTPGLTTLRRER